MPRKYGKASSRKVEKAMTEMNQGTLRSGGSGKKVTNPKQAIAIGLSEARRAGAKVPRKPTAKPTARSATRSAAKSAGKSARATPRRGHGLSP